MSGPYDRPTYGAEPGGCECMECGVIFVGAAAHDKCAVCAAGWHPIEDAPTDGTEIKAGMVGPLSVLSFPFYAVTSKFIDGKWHANFFDRWAPYDPQPNRWQPLPAPPSNVVPGVGK